MLRGLRWSTVLTLLILETVILEGFNLTVFFVLILGTVISGEFEHSIGIHKALLLVRRAGLVEGVPRGVACGGLGVHVLLIALVEIIEPGKGPQFKIRR